MNRRSLGGKGPLLHSREMPTPPPSWQDELRAKAQASLSAILQKPSATQSPRRWKKQLEDTIAEAQHSDARTKTAEEKMRAAEARATEMEKRARAAESRIQAMEQRALTAEAVIARLEKETRPIAEMPSPPAPDHADALRQIEAAREAMRNAEERARKAEMRARDMEQRSLAAEAIIAGSR